jgi:hypothetical protein
MADLVRGDLVAQLGWYFVGEGRERGASVGDVF